MKIRFLKRTISTNETSVIISEFEQEGILQRVSYGKKFLLRNFRYMKEFVLCCIMPYKWLEERIKP